MKKTLMKKSLTSTMSTTKLPKEQNRGNALKAWMK